MKYPKKLYVYEEVDGEDSFYVANKNVEDCDDGKIGIYELVREVKKSTKTVLEEVK